MPNAVSEKGQATIPKRVRDQLVASKVDASGDVFKKWRGRARLPGGVSVTAYLAQARDGHGH